MPFHWRSSKQHSKKSDIANSYGADLQTLREINRDIDMETAYKESISVDVSSWHGARVVRLNIDGKPWSCHEDKVVEEFCKDFFSTEQFDEIQCHCCQVITASPLIVADRMNIPYDIVMHDAWWMSPEQFLVSNAGKIIDPSDPLGHFDHDPNEDEINAAMERREFLFEILKKARKRIAVSECFAKNLRKWRNRRCICTSQYIYTHDECHDSDEVKSSSLQGLPYRWHELTQGLSAFKKCCELFARRHTFSLHNH